MSNQGTTHTLNRPLKIGIIGVGNIVSTMHLPILYNLPDITISYLADLKIDPALAQPFGAKAISLDPSGAVDLPKVDLVFIATPPGVRNKYIEAAANDGSFILTEKPFAVNSTEHKKFISSTDRICCSYNRRNYGSIRQLKQIILSGMFGKLLKIDITEAASPRSTGKAKGHYQFNRAIGGGGILIERGCHTLSQLDDIFEDWELSVDQAEIKMIENIDIDNDLSMHLQGPQAEIVDLRYQLSTGKLFETQSIYQFENATVSFDHTDPSSYLEVHDQSDFCFPIHPNDRAVKTISQSFIQSWLSTLEIVRSQQIGEAEKMTSIRTTEWIEAAYRKANLI